MASGPHLWSDEDDQIAAELRALTRRGVSVTIELSPTDAYTIALLLNRGASGSRRDVGALHAARSVIEQITDAVRGAPVTRNQLARCWLLAVPVAGAAADEDR